MFKLFSSHFFSIIIDHIKQRDHTKSNESLTVYNFVITRCDGQIIVSHNTILIAHELFRLLVAEIDSN